MAVRDLK